MGTERRHKLVLTFTDAYLSVNDMNSREEHLESHLELGRSFGVAGGLIGGSLDVYGHGEDRSVHRTGLGQEAVLEARVDLIQPHQGVHGVVRIRHPPVQH